MAGELREVADEFMLCRARIGRHEEALNAFGVAMRGIVDAPSDEWHWLRHNPHAFCSINIRKDGTIDDRPEELAQTRDWMLDLLPKLRDVFDPRVEQILRESPPARDARSAGLYSTTEGE